MTDNALLLKEIIHELNQTPWVIKESKDKKLKINGFVDRPCLIFWINKRLGNCYETFISQVIHVVRSNWEENKIEQEAHKIWAEGNTQIKGLVQNYYFWLNVDKKGGNPVL